MAQTTSFTGRFGQATVAGVFVAITRWNANLHRELADSTDSNDYDAATQQTYQSQKPGVLGADGSIEGNFDLGGIANAQIIQKFKTGDGPYAVVLSYTRSIVFCTGNFDFSDVTLAVQIPGATMVTFTANFKTNSVFVLP